MDGIMIATAGAGLKSAGGHPGTRGLGGGRAAASRKPAKAGGKSARVARQAAATRPKNAVHPLSHEDAARGARTRHPLGPAGIARVRDGARCLGAPDGARRRPLARGPRSRASAPPPLLWLRLCSGLCARTRALCLLRPQLACWRRLACPRPPCALWPRLDRRPPAIPGPPTRGHKPPPSCPGLLSPYAAACTITRAGRARRSRRLAQGRRQQGARPQDSADSQPRAA
jgi:hypothetical protein